MLPRGLQVEKGTLTLTLSYNRFNGHLATTHYGVAVKLGLQRHLTWAMTLPTQVTLGL